MTACTAEKDGVPFSERCGAPASWSCPSGPRCDACMARETAAIARGECLIAVLAEEAAKRRGEDPSRAREALVNKYSRIQ